MSHFKTIIFCWAILFILYGLGLVFSEESFFQLSAIFSILFVVFYTCFSPSYFLNLEVSDSFAWFNFNQVPKIIAAVILAMPFWISATFMALSALSFPGYVLFPFTIIFGVVSYFFAVKQHKTAF